MWTANSLSAHESKGGLNAASRTIRPAMKHHSRHSGRGRPCAASVSLRRR